MPVGRVVPWISWDEWNDVRAGLLLGPEGAQKAALQRVATWRARGRIPLGVDMTACLVETRLR
jgi:ribosomal biogenesis protein LAS1